MAVTPAARTARALARTRARGTTMPLRAGAGQRWLWTGRLVVVGCPVGVGVWSGSTICQREGALPFGGSVMVGFGSSNVASFVYFCWIGHPAKLWFGAKVRSYAAYFYLVLLQVGFAIF